MTDRGMQVHLLIIISRAFLEACQQLALRRPMFNKIPLLQLKKNENLYFNQYFFLFVQNDSFTVD